MYVPPQFREDRADVLHQAMRDIAFATLVTQGPDGIEANHLPLLLEGNILKGHVARANPVWKSSAPDALAIFLGPNTYVTPSWYQTKAETGKVVPTWNYITVHAAGSIRWIEDPVWLRTLVVALSDVHEAGRETPWAVSDAPDSFIESQLRAIVGFELAITKLDGKWKMSQNRNAADIQGVRDGLAREGQEDIARLIP